MQSRMHVTLKGFLRCLWIWLSMLLVVSVTYDPLCLQAVKQLLLMLEVSPGGTAPRGDEAQRILSFFLSSLKNPQLQRPPPVAAMLSFGTLTPHCEWPLKCLIVAHVPAAA